MGELRLHNVSYSGGGSGSVDYIEKDSAELPERELPYYPSGEYSGLNTSDKHIIGAINEVKGGLSTWEDISSQVTVSSNVENFVYKINRLTGLKYIYFEVKPGVTDNTPIISKLPFVYVPNSYGAITIPHSLINYESIQLGNFSVYCHGSGDVYFRCKTPTSTVKVYCCGIIM